VAYRESVRPPRFRGEAYWSRPVPPWGDLGARLMIVGLAPAAHGGNRTGRMFTGDRSAQNLFAVLHGLGLSNKPYSLSRGDGVELRCVYITSAVKCAPPKNKPTAEEVGNCSLWLVEEVRMVRPRAVVALGRVAWDAVLKAVRAPRVPFSPRRLHPGRRGEDIRLLPPKPPQRQHGARLHGRDRGGDQARRGRGGLPRMRGLAYALFAVAAWSTNYLVGRFLVAGGPTPSPCPC
jgi:Uracil-DNA glycosylase